MDIFITGATGVLGHRLVERLSDRGHTVFGLARDEQGAALVEACGGTSRYGDVLDSESLEQAIDDVDTVIHAATSIPTDRNPSEEAWQRNDRVRLEGARNLVSVVGDTIDRMLFPSVVWVARPPDGSPFDETSQKHPDRTTQSAATVEEYLNKAAESHGFDVTVLRCGFFYVPDGATTREFVRNLLSRRMPIIGGGILGRHDAELSLVHADDAARAFAAALDKGITGLYHVVDNERVTFADYLTEFANRLDAPTPHRVPGWLARFIVGSETTNFFTVSMRTTNTRFCADADWTPKYPTYRDGLTQIIETWQNEGTLRQTSNGYEWVEK